MTNSSFAPNLADSGGASEDTFPSLRPPPTDPRPLTPDLCPPSSVLRPPASHFPPSTPRAIRAAAFSLVELLSVVGIIAMLSVAAVPVMRGLGGSQSSRATAQILVSALEQARTAAILSGTNAYLALPDGTFTATNYRYCSYAILRNTVDQDANGFDDFQTNVTAPAPPAPPGWILLSKWERLPGDLLFSSNLLTSQLTNRISPGVPFPGGAVASALLPAIGFTPGGGLIEPSSTAGLIFASSNKVVNGMAAVADRIVISLYSGRVRYAGLTNNVEF